MIRVAGGVVPPDDEFEQEKKRKRRKWRGGSATMSDAAEKKQFKTAFSCSPKQEQRKDSVRWKFSVLKYEVDMVGLAFKTERLQCVRVTCSGVAAPRCPLPFSSFSFLTQGIEFFFLNSTEKREERAKETACLILGVSLHRDSSSFILARRHRKDAYMFISLYKYIFR